MIKCPKCGKSHYESLGGTTTCMGWTPVFKDGVQVNHDPNKTTWHYRCVECGANFTSDDIGSEEYTRVVDLGALIKQAACITNVDDITPKINEEPVYKDEEPHFTIDFDKKTIFVINNKEYVIDKDKFEQLIKLISE